MKLGLYFEKAVELLLLVMPIVIFFADQSKTKVDLGYCTLLQDKVFDALPKVCQAVHLCPNFDVFNINGLEIDFIFHFYH